MFLSILSRQGRTVLRFAGPSLGVCLLAACLGAGFVSEAAAREAAAFQNSPSPVLMPKTPCPHGITLDAWEDAPTLWRMAYARCKPEGAPTRYEFNMNDAGEFIRRLGVHYANLGKLDDVSFNDVDNRTFRVRISMTAKRLTTEQAQTVAADVLRKMLLYLEINGYDPMKEKLKVSVRVRAKADQGELKVFAIFDNATGGIRYKMTPDK